MICPQPKDEPTDSTDQISNNFLLLSDSTLDVSLDTQSQIIPTRKSSLRSNSNVESSKQLINKETDSVKTKSDFGGNQTLTKFKLDLCEQIHTRLEFIQNEFYRTLKCYCLEDENYLKSEFDSVVGSILLTVFKCIDDSFSKHNDNVHTS